MYAMDQKIDQAIAQFNLSLNPNEAKDTTFLWNDYVMATICFLRKDRLGLIRYKNKLKQMSTIQANQLNLVLAKKLLAYFDQSYEVVYFAR